MIELPEAAVLASQLNKKVKGSKIKRVAAALSPHKFVWYHGNPKIYNSLLKAKIFNNAVNAGGIVEITADNTVLALSDGVGLRYHSDDKMLPHKHQLLIEFDNSTFLTASVQMYGGIMCTICLHDIIILPSLSISFGFQISFQFHFYNFAIEKWFCRVKIIVFPLAVKKNLPLCSPLLFPVTFKSELPFTKDLLSGSPYLIIIFVSVGFDLDEGTGERYWNSSLLMLCASILSVFKILPV